MERHKSIFCDIDGTLWMHVGGVSAQAIEEKHELLPNTKQAIDMWDRLGYNIILTTGRKESLRKKTEHELLNLGIVYDQLIMGLGGGDRILINDKKPNGEKNTCYAINITRNKGIPYYNFTSNFVTIPDQPRETIKSWGKEEIIDYNDHYIMNKVLMKAEKSCNMQYHELKRKTIYVLNGKLQLCIGTDINNLEHRELVSGDNITIKPYTIHIITGIENSEYIECSTPEYWDVGSTIKYDDYIE